MKPVTLADVKEISGDLEAKSDLRDYLKEFSKLTKKQSDNVVETLRKMNNAKFKEEYIVKVADLIPKNAEGISKIFSDVSLDEKEINEILAVVKEY
jgi:DNA-directed RNA polymerase subunit F